MKNVLVIREKIWDAKKVRDKKSLQGFRGGRIESKAAIAGRAETVSTAGVPNLFCSSVPLGHSDRFPCAPKH